MPKAKPVSFPEGMSFDDALRKLIHTPPQQKHAKKRSKTKPHK